jgi:hypothetical protein
MGEDEFIKRYYGIKQETNRSINDIIDILDESFKELPKRVITQRDNVAEIVYGQDLFLSISAARDSIQVKWNCLNDVANRIDVIIELSPSADFNKKMGLIIQLLSDCL